MSDDTSIDLAPVRSVAGIGAYRDQLGLHKALTAEFGMSLPQGARFVETGDARLCCLGPSRFLVGGERGANLPGRVARVLDGLAAVTDQSDLWIWFVVSGPLVRTVLSRVVPVDVRAATFPVGGLALTRAGHFDVRVFRTEEMRFEVAVARSYAVDLRHLLDVAAHCR